MSEAHAMSNTHFNQAVADRLSPTFNRIDLTIPAQKAVADDIQLEHELGVIDKAADEYVEDQVEKLEAFGADPPLPEHRANMRSYYLRKLGEWATVVNQSEQGVQ